MNESNTYLLYAVTDPGVTRNTTLEAQAEAAIRGGVTCVQLRDKTASKEEFLKQAISLKRITDQYHTPLIINDHVDIAKEIDAAGVHIGQSDMTLTQARKILGDKKIIGVSARTVELAVKAQNEGASYLGVGAVFGTTTKADAKPLEMDTLKQICDSISIPVVAIGGVNERNVSQLKGSGVSGVAIVSAIFNRTDVESASRELRKIMEWVVEA